jgi:hypothetical protein
MSSKVNWWKSHVRIGLLNVMAVETLRLPGPDADSRGSKATTTHTTTPKSDYRRAMTDVMGFTRKQGLPARTTSEVRTLM